MKRCVVNFADDARYQAGQERLRLSLTNVGFTGGVLLFQSHEQLGCPTHLEMNYAFKGAALKRAVDDGYTTLLWCDASVWATKSLDAVFDHIEREGHLLFSNPNGSDCRTWTSDACLSILGVTPNEAASIPQLMATCMGFDVRNKVAMEFVAQYAAHALDGSFHGSWNNDQQAVSTDPRCKGHRHDQSVASILANKLGMGLCDHATFFDWRPCKADTVCLNLRGAYLTPAGNLL